MLLDSGASHYFIAALQVTKFSNSIQKSFFMLCWAYRSAFGWFLFNYFSPNCAFTTPICWWCYTYCWISGCSCIESCYNSRNAFPIYQPQYFLEDPYYHIVASPTYLCYPSCSSYCTFWISLPNLYCTAICSSGTVCSGFANRWSLSLDLCCLPYTFFLHLLKVLSVGLITLHSLSWCIGSYNNFPLLIWIIASHMPKLLFPSGGA